MKTVPVTEVAEMETAHEVSVRRLHDSEHVQLMHIALQPGEALRKHVTPVDAYFYVLEGEGVVQIGEEVTSLTPDTLVESPCGIPHRLWNESDEEFRFLVLKTPRPEKPSRIL
jgi:quercetin dioxygenase-like cupin family protein